MSNNGRMSSSTMMDGLNLDALRVPNGIKPASEARKDIEKQKTEINKQKIINDFVKDKIIAESLESSEITKIVKHFISKDVEIKNICRDHVEISINGDIFKVIK